MLVLSRQRDQSIIIGDDIEITVVDIRGEKVRLGISAPAHIAVHRKEVYDSMKNSDASGSGGAVKSLAKKHNGDKPK
jgi:carbon storage regulator